MAGIIQEVPKSAMRAKKIPKANMGYWVKPQSCHSQTARCCTNINLKFSHLQSEKNITEYHGDVKDMKRVTKCLDTK